MLRSTEPNDITYLLLEIIWELYLVVHVRIFLYTSGRVFFSSNKYKPVENLHNIPRVYSYHDGHTHELYESELDVYSYVCAITPTPRISCECDGSFHRVLSLISRVLRSIQTEAVQQHMPYPYAGHWSQLLHDEFWGAVSTLTSDLTRTHAYTANICPQH
jgi:hypothetical protein